MLTPHVSLHVLQRVRRRVTYLRDSRSGHSLMALASAIAPASAMWQLIRLPEIYMS